ncbi:MAG: V-type ATP synthase subunit F [Candidatus Aminicenantales bacterium]
MFNSGKVAAIGDEDLLFGLRALGVRVFSPRDEQEARRILSSLEKEKFVLCLIHQEWLEALGQEKKIEGKKPELSLVGFTDYRTLTDTVEKMVREMAIKATGSDALVKRKGKDESG